MPQQPSRRDFLKLSILGLAGAGLVGLPLTQAFAQASSATAPVPRKPNVVLMIGDDMTFTDLGCWGNKDVKTPNLDRFATEGVRLTHCFTTTAMCAPTRAQLYTGLFPIRSGGYPNHCKVNPGVRSMPHYLKGLGYRVGLIGKTHIAPLTAYPFEFLGDKGDQLNMQAIEQFISRDKGQPYCLIVCSHQPHGPWNSGDAAQYDPARLTLPPYLVDTPQERKMLAAYYAEITDLDRQIGRCLKIIDESGRRDDTLVAFISEQGSSRPHGKWTCYDAGLRAAGIVRWPGRVKPGSTSDAMVQYVDFLPTFIEAAGGAPVDGLDGKSFLPVLTGEKKEHRDVVYGVHTTRGIIQGSPNYPIRSIRTRTHKYIMNLNHEAEFRNVVTAGNDLKSWREKAQTDPHARELLNAYLKRPAEEFYDVVADPMELNNLAGDPQYRTIMDELRRRLEAWMQEQGDRGVATELEADRHLARGMTEGGEAGPPQNKKANGGQKKKGNGTRKKKAGAAQKKARNKKGPAAKKAA